jgi:uncharacterized repeat protein (TIGR03803 family)
MTNLSPSPLHHRKPRLRPSVTKFDPAYSNQSLRCVLVAGLVLLLAAPAGAETFRLLHSFTPTPVPDFTNSDGAYPGNSLVLSDNTLYGTATYGGSSGSGTVFALHTGGGDFAVLHSITPTFSTREYQARTNSDGAYPNGLILSGQKIYGTARYGGSSGSGTVFALNTDGSGFTNLHEFTVSGTNPLGVRTNSDGAAPTDLVLVGNTLYGTAYGGGGSGNGTVFTLGTEGASFTILYSFSALNYNTDSYRGINSDGAYPTSLILSGNTLYGTAYDGGSSGNGTVFSISFPPQLTIVPSVASIIVTWPINYLGFDYTGYTLESTINLVSAAGWNPVTPSPSLLRGQKVVVKAMSGTQQFFRLSQ